MKEEKKELSHKFQDHAKGVRALEFSSNSGSLVSGSEDLHVNIYDVEELKIQQILTGHSDFISTIAMRNMDMNTVISGGIDKKIIQWDLRANKVVRSAQSSAPVWSVKFSPCGEYFAAASEDGTIAVYQVPK
jgi:WD40 repeat protein